MLLGPQILSLTGCMLGIFFMLLLSSVVFFNINFKKNLSGPNGLNPDQDLHFLGPDLGPNCFQRLSTVDKSRRQQGKS